MTSSVAGQRKSSKALPKAKLAPKKSHDLCWWYAARLIHYNFLNPREIITSDKYARQIDEVYRKLQCPQPVLVSRKGPMLLHDNAQLHVAQSMLQKLNEFCPTAIFTRPLTKWQPLTSSSISTTSCREKASTTSRRQKMLSKSSSNLKHGFLRYRNKQTYFSLANMCWLKWFLFWLIKMCVSLVIMIENSQSETAVTFIPT